MGARGKLPKNKLPVVDYPTTAVQSKPSKEQVERERRYKAEDALRVLTDAEKYKADKSLMSDVKELIKEKRKCLDKIK